MDTNLFRIIMYISIVAWLFPPIKQYKQSLFSFFLILALTDPVAIILGKILEFPPHLFYNFSCVILLFSLNNFKDINKKSVFLIILLLIIGFASSQSPSKFTFYYIILINFIILVKFLIRTLLFVMKNSMINVFHMILILYQTTIILKVLSVVENFSSGVYYFALTNIFQIVIAIFFTIFNESDESLYLNLKNL